MLPREETDLDARSLRLAAASGGPDPSEQAAIAQLVEEIQKAIDEKGLR